MTNTLTISDTELAAMFGPDNPWQLVLWNDDVNSFEYVIKILTMVLEIPSGRAAQLAVEAHSEGRAIVRDGTQEEMTEIAQVLANAALTVSVERPD